MKLLRTTKGLALVVVVFFVSNSCNNQPKTTASIELSTTKETSYKVTFIELGSIRCIPCQQMQPIMKSIKEKYAGQVNVVFHDVWTEAGAPYAIKYGVGAIPTQVFLDETGKEFFRHIGFFPEAELIKVLNQKGID
jgi:thioredoxin 1